MVERAQAATMALTSVSAIRWYVREMLQGYTSQLLRYRPLPDQRAIEFKCEPSADTTTCRVPSTQKLRPVENRRVVRGQRCGFLSRGVLYDTLHDAAHATFGPAEPGKPSAKQHRPSTPQEHRRSAAAIAAARALVCSASPRINARAMHPPQWCFDFNDAQTCNSHAVPGKRGQAQRQCLWRPDLIALGLDVDHTCPCLGAHLAPRGACVAACCTSYCNITT
jgi:hypothetical protein